MITRAIEHVANLQMPVGDKKLRCTYESNSYRISIQSKLNTRAAAFLNYCKEEFEQFLGQIAFTNMFSLNNYKVVVYLRVCLIISG